MSSGRGLWRLAVSGRVGVRHPGRAGGCRRAADGDAVVVAGRRHAAGVRLRRCGARSACGSRRTSTPISTASRTGSRWTSSGRKRRTTGLKVPVIMDASPYYSTLGRGNESELQARISTATACSTAGRCSTTTTSSRAATRSCCSTWSARTTRPAARRRATRPSILSAVAGIDWLNGRRPGYDKDGNLVVANWHNGKTGMIGKSYDGTLANGAASTGVDGPVDDRADLGDLELVRLRALERASGSTRTTRRRSRTRSPTRPTGPAARPSG